MYFMKTQIKLDINIHSPRSGDNNKSTCSDQSKTFPAELVIPTAGSKLLMPVICYHAQSTQKMHKFN